MIPVTIEALIVGQTPDRAVLVLRPFMETGPNPRVLPIHIGVPEAMAIGAALNPSKSGRPQTHDLLMNLIHAMGGEFMRVIIDRVEGMSFYAKIVVQKGEETIEIDARPSDAIIMAIKADAPVYLEPPVYIAAAVQYNVQRDDLQEREFEAFQEYIENIEPDDFKSGTKGDDPWLGDF